MSDKNIPETKPNISKIELSNSKKVFAGLVVIAVIWLVAKKLREQNKPPMEADYITALARSHVETDVNRLSDSSVEEALKTPDNVWKKRKLIEWALSIIFGSK